MKNTIITLVVLAVLIFGGYFLYNKSKLNTALAITTYEACVEAGYQVIEGSPNRCLTPDGRTLEDDSALASVELVDGSYVINSEKTNVVWEGRKKFVAGYVDRGTIDMATSSTIVVSTSTLASATLVFDMSSIGTESTGKGSDETKLTGHLKSDDFFNVELYPTSKFVLRSVEVSSTTPGDYVMVGLLTIRDKTNEIRIPAKLTMVDGAFVATGEVSVDRTKFNVKFGSTSFFADLVGDRVVEDEFKLIFTVVADKK